jgi:hypothetical protein
LSRMEGRSDIWFLFAEVPLGTCPAGRARCRSASVHYDASRPC